MKSKQQDKIRIWQQHIESAESIPGDASAYCRSQGIQVASFYQWRKKLSNPARRAKPLAFLPVVVSPGESVQQGRATSLPDARWVAEVLAHFVRVLA